MPHEFCALVALIKNHYVVNDLAKHVNKSNFEKDEALSREVIVKLWIMEEEKW